MREEASSTNKAKMKVQMTRVRALPGISSKSHSNFGDNVSYSL